MMDGVKFSRARSLRDEWNVQSVGGGHAVYRRRHVGRAAAAEIVWLQPT